MSNPHAAAARRRGGPEGSLLLVHAHPDDESIATGGVMARYAAEGRRVTLVTCTRGEEGEIVPPGLRDLGTGKPLADVRVAELAAACAELGVTDHRFLGPYEDSGMIGTPENDRPTAFWNADLDEAADHLVRVVEDVRPDVVVTYDEHGGYGHPDHIQAHRVTLLAVERAGYPIAVYYTAWTPHDPAEDVAAYQAAGRPGGYDLPGPRERPTTTPTTVVDVSAYLDRKRAAMAAHRTQLTVTGDFFALSDNVMRRLRPVESFVRKGGGGPPEGLFP